ncbi:MAG: ThiF family adenylyltransferase [Flavobacteriales bacterium]|nr:ThiF family adenylyltransferase [Flavobacteriales bacterium]MBP7155009.1 ThiF family adenylyltransferase [Flavobacteriales bacterium]HQV74207.1 ThiF family adenylyltransferase [Flavobacteriales bacterium]
MENTEGDQSGMHDARIAVIGVGGTGCALLPLLVALPVHTITLIDGDTVERRNLSRQPLYGQRDVGKTKVLCARYRMGAVAPFGSQMEVVPQFIDANNCFELLKDHALVADCTDDLDARKLIASTCSELGIPLVSGAVHGMQIQVTTVDATVKGSGSNPAFFQGSPAEEQTGCDMRIVPAAVTTITASLMALRIEDLLRGGHGHAGMMDLLDIANGRWMRIMGPTGGEIMDSPTRPQRHV